jgi:hypothetical protein
MPPTWASDAAAPTLLEGRDDLLVVGESFYQEALWRVAGGVHGDDVRVSVVAVLMAETDNPYDANAVSVWVDGLKVGHLSRDDAVRLRPGLLALEARLGTPIGVPGAIVGGGLRPDGEQALLGIFLRYDPEDFEL